MSAAAPITRPMPRWMVDVTMREMVRRLRRSRVNPDDPEVVRALARLRSDLDRCPLTLTFRFAREEA